MDDWKNGMAYALGGAAVFLAGTLFRELLEEMEIVSNMTIPDIKPILIHCGQEAGIREDLQGEEEIRNYFEKGIPNGVQLVEMLYCKDGCHNGDGIKRCGI